MDKYSREASGLAFIFLFCLDVLFVRAVLKKERIGSRDKKEQESVLLVCKVVN